MKNGMLLTVLSASFVSLLMISCGNDSGQNSNNTEEKKYRDDELNSITYSGSLIVSAAMLGSSLKLDSETPKVYEISAPLFPIVTTLYKYENSNYPTTADGQKALAKDGYTTFEKIRDACLTKDPRGSFSGGIKTEDNSQALAVEDRAENYSNIAQCAYEYFG